MIAKLVRDDPRDIFSKEPQFRAYHITIGDSECRVLVPQFNAASHKFHQSGIPCLRTPVNLINKIRRPVRIGVTPLRAKHFITRKEKGYTLRCENNPKTKPGHPLDSFGGGFGAGILK